jgi:RHS repeat-associated protein
VVNTYAYNKRRLLTGESQASGSNTWTVGYGYDGNASLSTLVYPDDLAAPGARTVAYAPNALGQPTQAGSYASNVTYYPNGAIAGFTYGNGIVHTLTQNTRGLPAISEDANGATPVHHDEYTYDNVGNVLYIVDGVAGNRGDRDMVYDNVNRLTSATSPMFGTASYTYDAADNLRHVAVTAGSQARDQDYCYDEHWRLTNVKTGGCDGGTTIVGLGYDAQGNLANKSGVAYTFDYGNRLRSGGPEMYRYDVQGRRIRSINSTGQVVYSLYAQSGQLLFQRDERASKRRQYIYLGGSLVAESDMQLVGSTATVTYQHTDALGSPVATTNSAKSVLQHSEYEPYGYLLNRPMEDGPGYTGHVTDAATGLVYMQQRYYDPLIGRFDSTDSITAYEKPVTNFNRYIYALNNPYLFTDPDGRDNSLGILAKFPHDFGKPSASDLHAQASAQRSVDLTVNAVLNGNSTELRQKISQWSVTVDPSKPTSDTGGTASTKGSTVETTYWGSISDIADASGTVRMSGGMSAPGGDPALLAIGGHELGHTTEKNKAMPPDVQREQDASHTAVEISASSPDIKPGTITQEQNLN